MRDALVRSKVVRRALLAVVLFLVVAQFAGPQRTNPPVDPAETLEASGAAPAPVVAIVRRACFNCHSHETEWPLYAHVAPVSWLVIGHVDEGREHLNFSRWGRYPPLERADLLDDACKLVRSGDMPLPSYRLLHREARLSASEIAALCEWTQAEARRQEKGDDPSVSP